MNREVFLSILAMDSYQRGYSPGIKGLLTPRFGANGSATSVVKIGEATIIRDSSSLKTDGVRVDIPVGFYAVEYAWNGETVISYRGTDFDAGNELVHDFVYGWSSFTGLWKASQFPLASQFYTAVTGRAYPVGNEVPAQNITTVGHSLGGALAGLVAARGKTDSYLVNPIPYGATAWGQAIGDALTATFVYFGQNPDSLAERIRDSAIPGLDAAEFIARFAIELGAREPDLARVRGVATEGEVASLILDLQGPIGGVLSVVGLIFGQPLVAAFGLYQVIQAALNNAVENRDGLAIQENHDFSNNPVTLHSIGVTTLLQYGDKQWRQEDSGSNNWKRVAKDVLPLTFNKDIANAVGYIGGEESDTNNTGLTSAAEQLARTIAYSAINEGTLVFGDTGIRALFNDMDDMGRVKSAGVLPSALKTSMPYLSELIVLYASKLAIGKVTDDAVARQGVLTNNGDVLVVDLGTATWAKGAGHSEILGRSALIGTALSEVTADNVLPGDRASGFVTPAPTLRSDLVTGLKWLYSGAANDNTQAVFHTHRKCA